MGQILHGTARTTEAGHQAASPLGELADSAPSIQHDYERLVMKTLFSCDLCDFRVTLA